MSDDRLEIAVSNWGPRFVANGVDASDFARITAGLTSWDQWCDAWCDAAAQHEALGESAIGNGATRSAGEAFARAATYYHFSKFLFTHDRERERAAHRLAVGALTRALPLLDPPGRRVEFPFDGSTLVGVLRTPAPGPQPTVLLIPGLDSTKEEFRDVERTFLERGMATFSLDGPGQGEAEWTLPIRPDWEVVGEAILTHLAAQPEVDPERIGVWGVSLGGFYATRLASADLPVRAVIALSGPYDFGASWSQLNPLTRGAFRVRAGARDEEEAQRRADTLTMAGRAALITRPLLVIMGQRDRLFSWHEGERVVTEARGEATLWAFEDGNHGCANVVYRHRPQSADWMAVHLEVR